MLTCLAIVKYLALIFILRNLARRRVDTTCGVSAHLRSLRKKKSECAPKLTFCSSVPASCLRAPIPTTWAQIMTQGQIYSLCLNLASLVWIFALKQLIWRNWSLFLVSANLNLLDKASHWQWPLGFWWGQFEFRGGNNTFVNLSMCLHLPIWNARILLFGEPPIVLMSFDLMQFLNVRTRHLPKIQQTNPNVRSILEWLKGGDF